MCIYNNCSGLCVARGAAIQKYFEIFRISKMDLVEQIAHQQVELLNSNSDAAHVLRTGYREDGALTVASECDAQMFFHIPFTTRAR